MKTFSTNGTGSGQTLSEIESDKIPIYDSMADAEADLANLSEGQIVATNDTGDELAQPVDVVESGNLHAVTSNAVAGYIKSVIKANNSASIAGNTSYNTTIGIGEAGYTPILAVVNSISDNKCFVHRTVIDGNNVKVYIQNLNTVSVTITFDVTVIYKVNTN